MFSVIFAKFLKAPFLQNPSGWLLPILQVWFYLKAYQIDINWGSNSDSNTNTEHIFVFSDNFRSHHPE